MVNYDDLNTMLSIATNNEIGDIKDYDLDLTQIGLDSIYTVSLLVLLEEKYHIEFTDNDFLLDKFSTLNEIKSMVEKCLKNIDKYTD